MTNTLLEPDFSLAFTGTLTFDHNLQGEDVFTNFCKFIDGLPLAVEYITGAAVGFDSFIGQWMAIHFPMMRHIVYVPSNYSKVSFWWRRPHYGYDVEEIQCPGGTTYKYRNKQMVNRATELVAVPRYRESHPLSRRSGTWQTIKLARKQNKTVHLFILEENK